MAGKGYVLLEDLEIYQKAMEIGEIVWKIVHNWEYFPKSTLGKQFLEAADSIAANISEGYGRFHYKDKRNFYYYARGSLHETKTWSVKAKNRSLFTESNFEEFLEKLKKLHLLLNSHIKSLPIS